MAGPDDLEMQSGSAPTIYTRASAQGRGGISLTAAAAADIVPERRQIFSTPGPTLADGMSLVDSRISNNHQSPC